jgi:hypothetical protein
LRGEERYLGYGDDYTSGGLLDCPEVLQVSRCAAKAINVLIFSMPARLYSCDILLERLPLDLQDVAAALRPCLQEEHPVAREGHLARRRHLAPAEIHRG